MQVLELIHEAMPTYTGHISAVSYNVFSSLVSQPSNDAFDPARTGRYQDMSRPLSHYYIATSHKSYLEGDQLTGASTVNRYVDILSNNCRCVDIDCWDGESGEPVVCHGNSSTGKISFFGKNSFFIALQN